MRTEFSGHGVFLVFSSAVGAGQPAARVLGPYRLVRFSAKGIWAVGDRISEPVRVATQGQDLGWELDGFGTDEPVWGNVEIVAPDRPTSAAEIEAAHDWIRPRPAPQA